MGAGIWLPHDRSGKLAELRVTAQEDPAHVGLKQKPSQAAHQVRVTCTLLSTNCRRGCDVLQAEQQPQVTPQGGLKLKWTIRAVWHWAEMARFCSPPWISCWMWGHPGKR